MACQPPSRGDPWVRKPERSDVAPARIGVARRPADRRVAGLRPHEADAALGLDRAAQALRVGGRGEARDRDAVQGAAVQIEGRGQRPVIVEIIVALGGDPGALGIGFVAERAELDDDRLVAAVDLDVARAAEGRRRRARRAGLGADQRRLRLVERRRGRRCSWPGPAPAAARARAPALPAPRSRLRRLRRARARARPGPRPARRRALVRARAQRRLRRAPRPRAGHRPGRWAPRKPALRPAPLRRPGPALAAPGAGAGAGGRSERSLRSLGRGRFGEGDGRIVGGGREREADRLARILARRHAEQAGDLRGPGIGPGEGRPLLQARAELGRRQILRRDRAGAAPVAGDRISEREILADARRHGGAARGVFEDGDRPVGAAGERIGKADVGRRARCSPARRAGGRRPAGGRARSGSAPN